MCKIFAMTNMEKVELTPKFINTVKNEVCRLSDKHGFGYAVLGEKGKLGGERTMRPFNFSPLVTPSEKVVSKLPIVLKSSNTFGKIDILNPKSFIAHGRFSTNHVNLPNTHPFTNGEIALIHNGVVRDKDEKIKNLTTTCDSEILLRCWELGGIKEIESTVTGYYALAVLDKKGKLHIARDDQAMLYLSYCRTVNSFIIATTPEIIINVAKKMKWKVEEPEEMVDNCYAVFDRNEIISYEKIQPRKEMYAGWRDWDKTTAIALGKHIEENPVDAAEPSYREIFNNEDYYSRFGTGSDDAPELEHDDPQELDKVLFLSGQGKKNLS